MFENFNLGDHYQELRNLEHPLRATAEKRKNQAWENLRAFVEDRLKEQAEFYTDKYADGYAEAMRDDNVVAGICEDDEFRKLMAEVMEWTI